VSTSDSVAKRQASIIIGRQAMSSRHSNSGERGCARRLPRIVALIALSVVLVLTVAYAVTSAYLTGLATTAERHLAVGTPSDLGLDFQAVSFVSPLDQIELRGWYLPAGGKRAIIFIHGIHGNRWDTFHHIDELIARHVRAGYDVLTFDMRAHGESGGDRFTLGWKERYDVRGAVDFVMQRGIPPGRIGLWAQSLGSASALLAAPDLPEIAAVVTDSAFADARLLIDNELQLRTGLPQVFSPGITLVGGPLYGIDLDAIPPEKAVARIAPRPILFIHGDADTRIPVEHSRRLLAAAQNPAAELWVVPGANHVQSFASQPEAYAARVLGFFGRALGVS
jgi:fermentation-respiration switch protein FrsA (DUF1100 family)